MHRRRIPLAAVVLVLAACGDDQGTMTPTDETSNIATSTTLTPTTTSTDTEPEATAPTSAPTTTAMEAPMTTTPSGPSVDVALADLAERLDVSRDDIEVVSVEEVTWRDGSLGCPEPGRSYTQALVDGQRIVLAVDGAEHAYHSGRGREPFYCPPERAQDPSPDLRT